MQREESGYIPSLEYEKFVQKENNKQRTTAALRKNGWIYDPSNERWNRENVGLVFRESFIGPSVLYEYFLYIGHGTGVQLWNSTKTYNDLRFREEFSTEQYLNLTKLFYFRENFVPDNFLELGPPQ
jgi:hypothetical protein